MTWERYELRRELSVKKIITFFYAALRKNYNDGGERHDFWELVYVDRGAFEITTDHNRYMLKQGECVFYKPNEFHQGQVRRDVGTNLIVITFECDSPHMAFFEEKSFRFSNQERDLLLKIVKEGDLAFSPPIETRNTKKLQPREDAPFGSEQMIQNYLEILLITLIRRGTADNATLLSTPSKERADREELKRVIRFLEEHLHSGLSLADISKTLFISQSRLKTLFKTYTGLPPIRYYNKLKMDKAKEMMREGSSLTEISERLGFCSLPHFSRSFKAATDMSPTEYAKTVRSRM